MTLNNSTNQILGVNTMKNNSVFIEHWCYTKPDLVPNQNGDIIIIKKVSFGPLEVYEWGIDFNNIPYECYKWVENNFYEYENYRRNITREELFNQILLVVSLFKGNGLSELVTIYEKILDGLNSMLSESFERVGEFYGDRKKRYFSFRRWTYRKYINRS